MPTGRIRSRSFEAWMGQGFERAGWRSTGPKSDTRVLKNGEAGHRGEPGFHSGQAPPTEGGTSGASRSGSASNQGDDSLILFLVIVVDHDLAPVAALRADQDGRPEPDLERLLEFE